MYTVYVILNSKKQCWNPH